MGEQKEKIINEAGIIDDLDGFNVRVENYLSLRHAQGAIAYYGSLEADSEENLPEQHIISPPTPTPHATNPSHLNGLMSRSVTNPLRLERVEVENSKAKYGSNSLDTSFSLGSARLSLGSHESADVLMFPSRTFAIDSIYKMNRGEEPTSLFSQEWVGQIVAKEVGQANALRKLARSMLSAWIEIPAKFNGDAPEAIKQHLKKQELFARRSAGLILPVVFPDLREELDKYSVRADRTTARQIPA